MNEAVERAHREGVLTSASLMVAAPAAVDAVRRARSLPSLRVGLHLVAVEGPAILGADKISALAGARPPSTPSRQRRGLSSPPPLAGGGREEGIAAFPPDQLALALRYAFHPAARRQLAAEIRAQFAAFQATGLALDHANAHKHMHLHPIVGRMMIEIGRDYGLRAVRIPAEPPTVLRACSTRVGAGARALHAWSGFLRSQARRAGLAVNDHAFGIAWSGHMTTETLLRLAPLLPSGLSEIYFHPATHRDTRMTALMPDYEHESELAALLDPRLRDAFVAAGASITSFTDEDRGWSR